MNNNFLVYVLSYNKALHDITFRAQMNYLFYIYKQNSKFQFDIMIMLIKF